LIELISDLCPGAGEVQWRSRRPSRSV
jgi:hypothetical protein